MDDDLIEELQENRESATSKQERSWMERQDSQKKIGTFISMSFDTPSEPPMLDIKPSFLEELKSISDNLKEVEFAQDTSNNHTPTYIGNSTQKSR